MSVFEMTTFCFGVYISYLIHGRLAIFVHIPLSPNPPPPPPGTEPRRQVSCLGLSGSAFGFFAVWCCTIWFCEVSTGFSDPIIAANLAGYKSNQLAPSSRRL
jgi:hypothetical protein